MNVDFFESVTFDDQHNTEEKNPLATLVYLGNADSFILNQILLQQNRLGIKSVFTPETNAGVTPLVYLSNPLGNETFMKRYMLIEKAKKASVFGIVVVNSWVHAGGKSCVKNLLDLLSRHKKKAYVFTMSRPFFNRQAK